MMSPVMPHTAGVNTDLSGWVLFKSSIHETCLSSSSFCQLIIFLAYFTRIDFVMNLFPQTHQECQLPSGKAAAAVIFAQ